jgi:hypothetical protein
MPWYWPFSAKFIPNDTIVALLPGQTLTDWPSTKAKLVKLLGPAPAPTNWGGLLGYIEDHDPNLYVELWLLDCAGSGILFQDPNHTISWHVATLAAAGNPIAKAFCAAFNLLSPNHCANVLATALRRERKAGK